MMNLERDPYWWKKDLDYWQERLTDVELRLVRTFLHQLSSEERERRAEIMRRQSRIDSFWGFFNNTQWGRFRTRFYKRFVHRFYRKQWYYVTRRN